MPTPALAPARGLVDVVAKGLLGKHKSLPSWLFYDQAGSALPSLPTCLRQIGQDRLL
jgi:uncharacterized SAM-dependent methyltransferase